MLGMAPAGATWSLVSAGATLTLGEASAVATWALGKVSAGATEGPWQGKVMSSQTVTWSDIGKSNMGIDNGGAQNGSGYGL